MIGGSSITSKGFDSGIHYELTNLFKKFKTLFDILQFQLEAVQDLKFPLMTSGKSRNF